MVNALHNIAESFRGLRGNARAVIVFYPLFSIPFTMSNIFFGLYLRALGISAGQMGIIMSISFVSTICLSFFSNTIIDRIGRKRFSLIADGIILPLTFLIRLLAGTFWLFIVASIIGGFMSLSGMTTNFMLSEDTPPEKRIYSFNAFNIIMIGSGFSTLIAGPIFDRLGVMPAEKLMLGITVVGMVTMAIVRNFFYKETGIGLQAMASSGPRTGRISLGINRAIIKDIFANKALTQALFIVVFFMAFTFVGSFNMSMYYTLYVTEVLGFTKSQASIFAATAAGFSLITALFVIPSLSMRRPKRNIVIGLIAACFSMVLLILTPVHNAFMLIGANALYALGFGITRPCSDALLANAAHGPKRAAAYSLMNLGSNSLNAIGTLVGGQLFGYKPALLYLFAMLFALLILIVLLAGYFSRLIKRRNSAGLPDSDITAADGEIDIDPNATLEIKPDEITLA
jgi:MFS family permease